MEKTFEFTPGDASRFTWYVQFGKSLSRLISRINWVIIILLVLLIEPLHGEHLSIGIFLLAALILQICFPFYSALILNRKRGLFGMWRLILSNEGVKWEAPNGENTFKPWHNLTGVYQNRRYFFFLTTNIAGIAMPKWLLSKEEEQELFEMIDNFNYRTGSKLKIKAKDRLTFGGFISLFVFVVILLVIIIDLLIR